MKYTGEVVEIVDTLPGEGVGPWARVVYNESQWYGYSPADGLEVGQQVQVEIVGTIGCGHMRLKIV